MIAAPVRAAARRAAVAAAAMGALMAGGPAGPAPAAADPAPRPDRLLASGQLYGYAGNHGARQDGNGDDGDLIRGRWRDYAPDAPSPPRRPADNVVVDRQTGLMWVRSVGLLDGDDGQGVRGNVTLSRPLAWQAAVEAANALVYAGFDDWRLPNVNELQTLADFGRSAPALDPGAFPEAFAALPSPYFWTSTTHAALPGMALYVNFRDGHVYRWTKGAAFAVRPVRDAGADDPVAVLRTGQAAGYRGDAPGAGNGDDGDLRRGLAPRYAWSDDGVVDTAAENVVVDLNTGLAWLRDPRKLDGLGGGAGVGGNQDLRAAVDWQSAIARCNGLDYAGHADWRLPNIQELVSIAQPGRDDVPHDPAAFAAAPRGGDVANVWWSSTTAAVDKPGARAGEAAWFAETGLPYARHHVAPDFQPPKSRPGFARCVRDADPRPAPDLYRAEIRSSADLAAVTVASASPGVERVGKFILPLDGAAPDAPVGVAFQDVHRHALHYDFLRAAFPERFGTLTPADYTAMVSPRATRTWLAGGLRTFTTAGGDRVTGFDVFVDSDAAPDLLTAAETAGLYRRLARAFRRPLVYAPTQPGALAAALGWDPATVPLAFPAPPPAPGFEAYTTGDGYGTVRRMTLEDLAAAEGNGRISWQDILVLDRAPTDIEGVVSGIVTGERQGDLSHLNVRAARRGTPNAFVAGSLAAFAPFEGQLVRLTVTRGGYAVRTGVTPAEAEAFWAARRPAPVAIPPVDAAHAALDDLAAIAEGDAGGRAATRFGAKAANLARLYAFLPARHQVPGFAVPFAPYADLLAATTIADDRSAPPVERPLGAYLADLHRDDRFLTDAAYRAGRLDGVRDRVRAAGAVPAPLVQRLADRIRAVHGDTTTMVRFRSSSNAEDGLAFNGAGLYDSTSVCAADSLDGDAAGPSRCDPNQPSERTIERGLRRVWASLWNFRAWEERAYYGVDHLAAGMAILVTPAFPDERANGVAFSGNPLRPTAPEYVVNVQLGDTSVVLPDPGVLPERDVLDVDAAGRVVGVRRVRPSSLVPPGTHVMSDTELRELGDVLTLARERFPVEAGAPPGAVVMLDAEFKLRKGDDQLILKQIRPFLSGGRDGPGGASALRIDVPAPIALCSMWRIAHPIAREHAEQVRLGLGAGEWTVDLRAPVGPAGLFPPLRHGPDAVEALPEGAPAVRLTPAGGDPPAYDVALEQRYALAGAPLTVTLRATRVVSGELNVARVDAEFLTTGVAASVSAGAGEAPQYLAPCGLAHLDPERLEVDLAGGQRAVLHLRKGAGGGFWAGYLWADLVAAEVDLAAGRRTVDDDAHLVYDALRHNWNERFWVLFDPPLGDAHGLEVAQTFLGDGRESFTAALLGADLAPLRPLDVTGARRVRPTDPPDGRTAWLPWAGQRRGAPGSALEAGAQPGQLGLGR